MGVTRQQSANVTAKAGALPRALSPKQLRFVEEYLVDLNASAAAARAGYSLRTAASQGHENLKKPEIAAAIRAAREAQSIRTQITADRVLEELARIGFSDLRHAFTAEGALKPLSALPDDTAPTISSVKVVTRREPGGGEDAEVEYVTEIKLWDKVAALERLGRHLGIFSDKTEAAAPVTVIIRRFGDPDD